MASASAVVLVAFMLAAGARGIAGFPSAAMFARSFPAFFYWTAAAALAGLATWLRLRRTEWGEAAGWAALAFAGQAMALQLVQAGPAIRAQLFFGWATLLGSYRVLFLAAVGLQALAAVIGFAKKWHTLGSNLRRVLSLPAALAFLALEFICAAGMAPADMRALVSGGFLRAAVLHASRAGLGLVIYLSGAACLALAAATLPEESFRTLRTRWERRNSRAILWTAAAWVVVVSSLLAWFALGRMPHVPDEVAYIQQAKYFAAGRLSLDTPPEPLAFECEFDLVDGPRWYAATPGGWPALLAAGVWLGVPWLVNPLLGGIAVLLAHRIVRRIYDDELADGTALLLAASPWLIFLSASLMPHPTTLVFSLLALLGVERARNAGSLWGGVLAGTGVGVVLHTRPLEAVVVAGVAGIWWLSAGWRRLRLAPMVATLLVGTAFTVLFLAYNKALTGDPVYAPISKFTDIHYYKGANRLGFGKDIGNFGWSEFDPLPGHGPLDVAYNTNVNVYLLNTELFGWASGSLVFVFVLLLWGSWRDDALMWGLLAATWAAMSLYWFSGGPDFGPRYWYQMILPCVVLTLRACQAFATRWAQRAGTTSGDRTWAFLALAVVLGFVNLLGWRCLDKYRNYRGVRSDVRAMVAEFGSSLVFVEGPAFPDYAAAVPFNPPTLDPEAPGPIFARDLGAESRARIAAHFPGRPIIFLAGPSITGSGFRTLDSPPSTETLPR
jgi:hypothetical protein